MPKHRAQELDMEDPAITVGLTRERQDKSFILSTVRAMSGLVPPPHPLTAGFLCVSLAVTELREIHLPLPLPPECWDESPAPPPPDSSEFLRCLKISTWTSLERD